MPTWLQPILAWPGSRWVGVVLFVAAGLGFSALLGRFIERALRRRLGPHGSSVARRLSFYALCIAIFFVALRILRVEIGTLLAAAGILGIAVGFAAQTSFSNIISGLFLIFERTFRVGDLIRVGEIVGEVLSIDVLSVKIRSVDNTLVRIPNESLLRTNVVNLTRYPIRRLDLTVSVAYGAPLGKALEVVRGALFEHVRTLRRPEPIVFVEGFGDSGINLVARVWIDRSAFVESKGELLTTMKEALDAAGIEIPFPHRKLLADPELLAALRARDAEASPGEKA